MPWHLLLSVIVNNDKRWRSSPFTIYSSQFIYGGVSEWPKEHAWKACICENVSWVRIPPPPKARAEQKLGFLALVGGGMSKSRSDASATTLVISPLG